MTGVGKAVKERYAEYPFHGNAHGLTMFEVTHVY